MLLPPPPGVRTLEERKVYALERIANALDKLINTAGRIPGDDITKTVKQ